MALRIMISLKGLLNTEKDIEYQGNLQFCSYLFLIVNNL